MGTLLIRSLLLPLFLVALSVPALPARAQNASDSEEAPRPQPPSDSSPISPAQLFASVEGAWLRGDAEALAALVDTAVVRIALKPGASPTLAPTRSAAAFLFQDQLRLVRTLSFQIQRFQVAKNSSGATALWVGDWGGRQGVQRLRVSLTAGPSGARWLLREVRARK
jgi:hypothetical protein